MNALKHLPHSALALAAALAAAGASTSAARADEVELAPKFGLRVVNGMMSNIGDRGGSSTTYGGMNVYFATFFMPKLSLGAGFSVDFDWTGGSIPLYGPEISGRYYLYGNGTRTRYIRSTGNSEHQDDFSFYLGSELEYRSYYINEAIAPGSTQKNTGTFMANNMSIGFERPISSNLEWNVEGSATAFTFGATDTNVRLKSYLLRVGLNFLW